MSREDQVQRGTQQARLDWEACAVEILALQDGGGYGEGYRAERRRLREVEAASKGGKARGGGAMAERWTGPLTADLRADGSTLVAAVPPERWPYGPPEAHDPLCYLSQGGLYCDCAADEGDGDV